MKTYSSKQYSNTAPYLHIFYHKCRPEPKHTHDFIEIVYVRSGQITEYVNGRRFDTKRGDLLFLNYNSVHEFTPINEASYYNICLYPETIENLITPENAFALLSLSAFNEISEENDQGLVSFSGSERAEIESILETMLCEEEKRQPMHHIVNESYMNIIIAKLLRKTAIPQIEEQTIWNELMKYIDNNLDADLSLEVLAKKCFYNPSYFSRTFKKKFDISLTEYVNKRRIEKAIQLLTETELSIERISQTVGFSYKSVFYRTFARITGTTPAEYRATDTPPQDGSAHKV